MTTPLTVIVPCRNEADNINPCLDSAAAVADEFLVADSGSTDGTLEKIQSRGDCRLIEREYVNSADFKNWVIPQAAHEWILLLDADERATPELIAEVSRLKEEVLSDTSIDAYWIPRRNVFMGKEIRFSGWQNDGVVRLFRRSCRYEPVRVHAEIDVRGPRLGKLRGALMHHTFRDFTHYRSKHLRYAAWGARDLFERGKKSGLIHLTLRPLHRFFRHYIFQGGFLEGTHGLAISVTSAQTVFDKYLMLWEMERTQRSIESKSLPVPPKESRHAA